jgi:hypothetical protein
MARGAEKLIVFGSLVSPDNACNEVINRTVAAFQKRLQMHDEYFPLTV